MIRSLLPDSYNKFLQEYVRNIPAMIGSILLIIIVLLAVFAPQIAPYDPISIAPKDSVDPPSAKHIMGTDVLGRDIYSRVLFGARISLRLGLVSVSIATLAGGILGLISGYRGGLIDLLIMRLVDAFQAFPSFMLALILVFFLGPSLFNAMVAVGIASIPGYCRTMRGSVLSAKENEYVLAARAVGCSEWKIMLGHILPNVVAPLIVIATVGVAWAILTAAGLSFLGMGAQPPTPEWGTMANEGRIFLAEAWWISSFPGLAIAITVISINLVGDGLRDALDPQDYLKVKDA
jgi:peptide/nickel transport system permease protein